MNGVRVHDADTGIRVLTLDRPHARNAFTVAAIQALHHEVRNAVETQDVRGIVLTGAEGAFCAGADLHEMAANLPRLRAHFLNLMEHHHAVVAHLLTAPKPVVTAIDGVATGGGLGLALAGDLRIGTPNTLLRTAFLPLGASPDGGSTWLLPRLIGHGHAQRLIYGNDPVRADEAHALGLLHRITSTDARQTAIHAARELAAAPPKAFQHAKRLLRTSHATSLRAHLDAERDANADAATSPELHAHILAFAKRARKKAATQPTAPPPPNRNPDPSRHPAE